MVVFTCSIESDENSREPVVFSLKPSAMVLEVVGSEGQGNCECQLGKAVDGCR